MRKKVLPFFLFLLLIFPFISAVPPVQSTVVAEEGLEIQATNFEYLDQYKYHVFRFRVYNASDNVYISPSDVTCSFGIIDNMGEFVYNVPNVTTVTGYIFMVNVTGENFSRIGFYHTGINCLLHDETAGGVLPQSLEVTPQGYVSATDSSNYKLFIILMIVCAAIFMLAYFLESDWMVFLAGILWILTGMYGMIYGIGNLTNLYTRGVSVIIMVIGMVLTVGSIYNLTGDND